jgi:hypothetical protein
VKRFQCPPVRRAFPAGFRLDRHHARTGAEHLGFGGDRLGGRRHYRHGDGLRLGAARRGRPFDRHDDGGDRRDRRAEQ